MSQSVIEVKNLSKVYSIGHERIGLKGTSTLRDALVQVAQKPVELFTGHQLKKEEFWALKNVSFDVQQGDVVGIIGRNGSGKSTLLKVLSQIVDPTRGEARMRGRVASLLEVGTGFHPELTGRENIFFNGAILGMKRREIFAKFDEIVAFSEVEQFLDTPVKFYSSGMYVRLAFAIAAHLDPDILIVDEVLAVGDAAFQKKSLGKMKDVSGQGRTVLFVSHNMSTVKSLCNKGILLANGEIAFSGRIEGAAQHYMKLIEQQTTLSAVKDRPRTPGVSLEAKLTRIDVGNHSDQVIDSREPTTITFTIEASKDLDKNVVLHCNVTQEGQTILRLLSEHSNAEFKLHKGTNIIECQLPATYLTGGMYSMNCSILFPGRETIGHIDEVYDAHSFSVEDLPLPNGEFLTQQEAVFWVAQKWNQNK